MLNPKSLPRKTFVKESERMRELAIRETEEKEVEDDDMQGEPAEIKPEDMVNYNTIVEEMFLAKDRLKMEKIQNADFEDDKVKEHIYKLKTGEDAIKFFAKYGNSTPIKFINCYQDSSNTRRPYDLLIEHDIQKIAKYPQYYTVSPTGIVRVYNSRPYYQQGATEIGEDTTEYISLSDWMKESTQFNIVSNIHLFKNFSAIKLFTFWRANVKYRKFLKIRQSLVKNVFFCKPVFIDRVFAINYSLYDIHSRDMVSFNNYMNKQVVPDMFQNDQRKFLQEAVAAFNKTYEKIVGFIDETIKKLKENKNEKLTSELEKINFGQQIKQKAIYLQKLEKQVKRLRDKLAKEDFSMRRDFIRLVIYMGIENLVKAMNNCLHKIKEEINKEDRGGLFIAEATFQANGKEELEVVLGVNKEDIISNLEKIIKDTIDQLRETHKTLTNAPFDNYKSDYTHKAKMIGPDIEKIIFDSAEYRSVVSNLEDKVKKDYASAVKYIQNYNICKEIEHMQKVDFKPKIWMEEKRDLTEIESRLTQFRNYKKNKDQFIQDHGAGVFYVDSKKMKASLNQYIEECMNAFRSKLREYYTTTGDETINDLQELNKELDPPKEMERLKDFTNYIKTLEMAKQKKDTLETTRKLIEKAYKMITANKLPESAARRDQCNKEYEKFNPGQINSAEALIVDKMQTMSTKLDEEKEANNKRVLTTLTELQNEQLTDIGKAPQDRDNIDDEIGVAMDTLRTIGVTIEQIQKKTDTLEDYTKRMKREKKEAANTVLKQLYDKFNERNKLWKNLKSYEENRKKWMEGEFLKLDTEDIEKTFRQYEADIANAETKMHLLVPPGSAKGTVDPVLVEFKNRLLFLKGWMPIIVALGNKNLNDSHWKQIFEKLKDPVKYQTKKNFNLQDLIYDKVRDIQDFIEEISSRASGEARIENDLNNIRRIWEETSLIVKPYNDSKDKFILSETENVNQLLEDHQAKIQSMLAMKYVVNIRDRVEEWENKLAMVQNTLEEWLECQKQWMYLENIFSAEDIQRELPGETTKFMQVDKFWKETMAKTNQKPNAIEAAANKDICERFQDNRKILEHVQKLLEDYLEKKRKLFPRFYFLTNDQLLEILSQTRNPHAVQPHLEKCFDNIKRIKFTEGQDSVDIFAMVSADPEVDPETVKFSEMVKATGLVEGWLKRIGEMMVKSLYDNAKLALKDYPEGKRVGWFFKYPAQCILMIDMIMWTGLMEEAILKYGNGQKDALQNAVKTIAVLIQEMVALVKTDLSVAERETIKSLIVLEVHNRDVTDKVLELKVDTVNNFEWAKQLRYYWIVEDDDCFAKQTNTKFRYGYEYLGNGTRLVITPLTDKCYMTLTGALHLYYGGAPEGPAGTGKTETTKDLAKSLAIQCIVFNCSGKLDFQTMGRFFSGLAQCGAWACFDEFNRIEIEVLSVIAQQILVIQNGVKDSKIEIEFEDKMISLNPRFGVFITMNPGYAGRTELPDNLKALFRPVAMMIPDYALIAEIILFSEGFGSAKNLSRKMVYLYKLSSEQLSKQKHYDFGMRAVKSVLVMAGSLRRQVPREEEESRDPVDLEAEVLLKAMRDSNVPKFLAQDLPLFRGIIQDLFPGRNVPLNPHELVKEAVYKELEERSLQRPDNFILKIIQLLETLIVRHGVMTVGETGTGKTTLTNVLAAALTALSKTDETKNPWFAEVKTTILNPKSITEEELFGVNDVNTNTFTHGIVSKLVTEALKPAPPSVEGQPIQKEPKKWFWFDGPVDAGWIENMNTVLDDNKMLCLPDGKRIKLPASFTMLFEVQDLAVASPATVSRCGMVFLEKTNLGIEPIIRTWRSKFLKKEETEFLEKQKEASKAPAPADKKASKKEDKANTGEFIPPPYLEKIFELITTSICKNIDKIRRTCREEVPSVDVNLVQSCLNLFEVQFNEFKTIQLNKKDKKRILDSEMEQFLNFLFVFSFYWTIGGNLEDKSRDKFNTDMREYFNPLVPGLPRGDLYNFFLDLDTRTWTEWRKMVTPFTYTEGISYFRILVETTDTVRFKHILRTMNSANYHVLLMGNGGVGKSSIVKDYLYNLKKDQFLFATTTFSAQTSSSNIQNLLLDKLSTRGRKLGPPSGKKMIFHFDDINMPKLDLYGAQPPNELLRQLIDQGGFYDLKKYVLRNIIDCCIVASCSPPGGGRNPVSPRLFRHFHMLWMPDLSKESMQLIFQQILRGYLSLDSKVAGYGRTADNLVKASVDIYQTVRSKLLPTPAKCHYTFNLRDLSKIVQGILQMSHQKYSSEMDLVRLWVHEECRIFHDRLVNEKDREAWYQILLSELEKHAEKTMDRKEADLLIFSDIVDSAKEYCEINDMGELLERAQKFCNNYNMTSKRKLDLVFFTDALKHLTRISRVIKQPRGNCLLIGVGGSGRQSLTRIAKTINEYEFFMIEITKNYKEQKWREDIGALLKSAGKDNKKTVFLFSDTQIIYESFLEDINNILNTGEVPNLWKPEDIDDIMQTLRDVAKKMGKEDNKDSLLELFVHLVRENLHIVLTFSPVGDKLRERCRQFPSIIDCCTIDWFERWPDEALYSVAINQINKTSDAVLTPNADILAKIAVTMHNDVIESSDQFYEELKRKYYITPTSYLELLKSYLEMFNYNKNMIPFNIKRYTVGLEKLKETNEQVKILQDKIVKFQPILDKQAIDNEAMKVVLEKENAIAKEIEKSVKAETEAAQKTADEVNEMKTMCEEEVALARPALIKAQEAASNIDPADITNIKAMTNPPIVIKTVMIATSMIFGVKETWEEAKKFVGQVDFLKRLQKLQPLKDVPDKLWKKLRQVYFSDPNFEKEKLINASKACNALAVYLENSEIYYNKQKDIAPKEERLRLALEKLAVVQADVDAKTRHLKGIQEKVANLNQQLSESMAKAESLKSEQEQAKKRLVRAEKLLSGLADESVRWKQSELELNTDLTNLIGNMLITSAILSYLGPFTTPFRKKLIKKWDALIRQHNIPFNKNYSLQSIVEPIVIREWQNQGLPADELSIDNGIIMSKCIRWPLMIDPQSQANRWIKNMRKDMGLSVVKLTNQNFVRVLTLAIQTGGSLIIENVEEALDPILEPVLTREVVKDKSGYKIKLGSEEIHYNQDFRLYITTKMSNPHYVPEIVIKITLINFTVTPAGLEDQLLIDVIKNEKPILEEQRDSLIVKMSDYNKQLLDLQDKILRQINEIQGNILDNEEIIITLEASKQTSVTIGKGMKEAKETSENINITREEYRPIAERGSILYFVIASLALVDPMYQYSLEFFISLFNRRLQNSQKANLTTERVQIVITDITESFYNNVCRGLFEKHKLMYSFLIATNIAMASEAISAKEWTFFSTGSYGELQEWQDKPDYVEESVWKLSKNLQNVSYQFVKLTDSMIKNEYVNGWKEIISSDNPVNSPIPVLENLSHFQKLLIYYTLSKEKLILFIKEFVKNSLGKLFIESPPFDLKASYDDSTCNTPIIFVLSPGADPMANLQSFAKEKEMDGARFRVLSLGQGQGPKAEELIKMGRINGDWICLQNCHLASTWMTELERIQENQGDVLQDYRLWLTSMPSNKFPVSVLQSGIKITNEPPRGIKANTKRSFLEVNEDWYNKSEKPDEFKKLFFSLSLFHAVVLERRKFGAIGWNIPYGWMNSDLETCRLQLKMYLDEQPVIPYDTLSFLIAVINYGGRVTDNKDERLIRAILNQYFTPQVMKEGYKFSPSGIYSMPPDLSVAGCLDYIEQLPLEDQPEVSF